MLESQQLDTARTATPAEERTRSVAERALALAGEQRALLGAGATVAIAAVLRAYALGSAGQNLYYAAAVRSMLDSWHNFFYASFDPAGALSIDKPPLGLWLQVGAVRLLGFHYWVLALPQVLAGIGSVFALFLIVRPRYGLPAAVLSALALAITPASVASARNNSLDTVTMLLMLLAAWSVLRACEQGAFKWLTLAGVLAGLAFNTKLFAALVPIPTFALAYLVARGWRAPRHWYRLAVAGGLLAAVAVSWIVAVSATPVGERPYIYNGYGNNIWAMAAGYNGLGRVLTFPAQHHVRAFVTLPSTNQLALASHAAAPSPTRLLTGRFGTQAGWFIPLALVGVVALFRRRRWSYHTVLWGGWLATGLVLFSSLGSFRAQYLEAMAAPLAVCSALGFLTVVRQASIRPRRAALTLFACGIFSAALLHTVHDTAWTGPLLVAIALAGAQVLLAQRVPARNNVALAIFTACLITAVYAGPAIWSVATALEPQTGSAARYPFAGPDDVRAYPTAPGGDLPAPGSSTDPVLTYLEDQSPDSRYLVMTERSLFGDAARYIIVTNRAVLTFDSFEDQALAASTLAALVDRGDLKFIELPPQGPWADSNLKLGAWFMSHCTDLTTPDLSPLDGSHLYECRPDVVRNAG